MESKKQKQYLITGGSGFLGINLIRYLLDRGQKIRSLDIKEFDYPEKDRIDWRVGDIRDRKTVDSVMSGVDIVVHCAAALPLYSKKDIWTTNVLGTRNLLEVAQKYKVERFIYISSTAVYGIPKHHPIKEDDQLEGVGFYGKSKIEAEKVCLEFRNKGMCLPILRPKSFIGPERLGVFALLYEWAKEGHNFPILGKGRNHYQLLDVEDLCQAIYLCASKEKEIVSDTFNIGAKNFQGLKDDFQSVLDRAGFGKKIKTIPFPVPLLIWLLRFLEIMKVSPLYKWIYETVSKDSFVSIEKAERILGFRPKYSNQQALIRNYEWYLLNLNKFSGQSGVSHRVPWKQGILRLLKFFF